MKKKKGKYREIPKHRTERINEVFKKKNLKKNKRDQERNQQVNTRLSTKWRPGIAAIRVYENREK